MDNTDVVRALFAAYLSGDADAAGPLVADDFVFTSPQDDHLDRTAWFDRCFPTAGRLESQQTIDVRNGADGRVFILYEYVLKGGGRFRNCEYITVRQGRISEVQVFFGGQV